jgi:hypothetical protein
LHIATGDAKIIRQVKARIFCFSFVVYLVLLLTQPCQDCAAVVNDPGLDGPYLSQQLPTDREQQPEECAPFCFCSCSGLAAAYHTRPIIVADDLEIKAGTPEAEAYTDPSTSSFQNSIWQPPKA